MPAVAFPAATLLHANMLCRSERNFARKGVRLKADINVGPCVMFPEVSQLLIPSLLLLFTMVP